MILLRYFENFVEQNEHNTITEDLFVDWIVGICDTLNIKECKFIMSEFREGADILKHNQYDKKEVDGLKELVKDTYENGEELNSKAHLENHRAYAFYTLNAFFREKLGLDDMELN